MKKKGEIARVFNIKRLLNYKAVVSQVPFFLFLALLAVIYIYNGHLADRRAREIATTSRQLKELQFEYKDVKGVVLDLGTQSKLTKVVEPLGLKELTTAPVIIKDSTDR